MAIHGFDIAVGMSSEASKLVHIFTVAAQYNLSQDERGIRYYSAGRGAGQPSLYLMGVPQPIY